MKDLGVVHPGSTLYIEFDSFGANGESLTLTGLAVTDVEVYKDGGTTQRASDNGYTLLDTDGIDFDSVTGIHGLSIDLADNSTAGFWAAGSHYRVVISSVTINGQTVSFTAATFRIGYSAAILNTTIASLSSQTSFTLTAGPAENDALKDMWAVIHDAASAVQKAWVLISAYTGASKTITLAAGATFTVAAGDNIAIMFPAPMQPATLGRKPVVDAAGLVDANAVKVGPTGSGTAQTARDIGASVLLSPGTGTGQVSLSSGAVTVGTNNDKTGYSLTATTGLGNQTADITGSLSGSVGSVTGNVGGNVAGSVGSVTGNVGGNVTGSVGSLAAQAKADVNAEVDSALDTAIPGSPTSNSINERVKTLDDAYTATRAGYLDNISAGAVALQSLLNTVDGKVDIIDGIVDAILLDTGTDGVVLSSSVLNSIADALLDRSAGVETNRTPRQALRLILASAAGKLNGAETTTVNIRDTNDTKNRIVATVDASGNRSAVTLDAT